MTPQQAKDVYDRLMMFRNALIEIPPHEVYKQGRTLCLNTLADKMRECQEIMGVEYSDFMKAEG